MISSLWRVAAFILPHSSDTKIERQSRYELLDNRHKQSLSSQHIFALARPTENALDFPLPFLPTKPYLPPLLMRKCAPVKTSNPAGRALALLAFEEPVVGLEGLSRLIRDTFKSWTSIWDLQSVMRRNGRRRVPTSLFSAPSAIWNLVCWQDTCIELEGNAILCTLKGRYRSSILLSRNVWVWVVMCSCGVFLTCVEDNVSGTRVTKCQWRASF